MKKQIILITLTLIAILVSVSACSAATLDVGPGGTYLNISSAYDNASDNGDTILIAEGQYSGEGNTNITIAKNITIQGQSQSRTIINGTGTNWIFHIQPGCNVLIRNLTLTNGTRDNGGAIYNTGNLTVENCTFTNNTAFAGGAIYNYCYAGSVVCNVTNSTFTNNTATYYDGGGAICNIGSVVCNLTNSTFTNNTAANYGGAIYNYCGSGSLVCNVTNCNFTNNTAFAGGAIYNGCVVYSDSSVVCNVTNCTFTNNNADYGGAIYNFFFVYGGSGSLVCNVTNCTFTNNTAFAGGAIYNDCTIYGGSGSVVCNVTNCTFTNNNAGYYGGAIYNYCYAGSVVCNLTNSTFTNNTAGNGGAINNHCRVGSVVCNVTNCTFTNNTAIVGGAIYNYCDVGSVVCNVTNSTFTNNNAYYYGGAIYNYQYGGVCSLVANFNRFYNNTAGTGDAIYNYGATVDAKNNWWGSNSPNWIDLISGFDHPVYWVILSVNATPETINNTQTSIVIADFNHVNGGGDLIGGHIPDGPITLDIPWGSLNDPGQHQKTLNTVNGVINLVTFFANEGAAPPSVRVNAIADGYITNDTEAAYININKVSSLIVTKTGPSIAIAGNTITYTITVTANGPDPANVQIVDNIPEILQGVTHDPFSLEIPAGGSKSVQITGKIPSNTLFGTIIMNSATVTSDTVGTITPSETVITIVTIQSDVIITKTVTKTRPNVGETITFTITAHNNGPSDALNVQIHDLMPADFTDSVITPSKGNYDNVTGIWALNLINGEEATLNLTGKVSAVMAAKNITNTAILVGTANSANATIYVPKSDLYITITPSKNNPKVGETFTLTYKLGNYGPDNAENVTITIPLPSGFKIGNIRGDGNWNYNAANKTITWTLANVPVGDPYLYITGNVIKAGSYVFGASISSDTYTINTEGTQIIINAVAAANAASNTINAGNGNTNRWFNTGNFSLDWWFSILKKKIIPFFFYFLIYY